MDGRGGVLIGDQALLPGLSLSHLSYSSTEESGLKEQKHVTGNRMSVSPLEQEAEIPELSKLEDRFTELRGERAPHKHFSGPDGVLKI